MVLLNSKAICPVWGGKRTEWIDFAKGIAIVSVIVAHTIQGPLHVAIFSFHMPLFFILSSATFKYSSTPEDLINHCEKSFKHLIIPATLLLLIQIIIDAVYNLFPFSLDRIVMFLKKWILAATYSSGVDVSILGVKISNIGVSWFLVVLF